jgi:hypothetical protein
VADFTKPCNEKGKRSPRIDFSPFSPKIFPLLLHIFSICFRFSLNNKERKKERKKEEILLCMKARKEAACPRKNQ